MGVARPLKAATYLGENTVPILRGLIEHLSGIARIEAVVDPGAPGTSAEAGAHAAGMDVVWMCGYLTMSLLSAGKISHDIVAAPVFPGHGEPVYHSVIVAPQSLADALATRLATNEPESWSGHHGLRAHVTAAFPGEWFADEQYTGSHRRSIEAVAERTCDVAAIDVTVWNYLAGTNPAAVADLRVIDRTIDWPAPPISLRSGLDPGLRAKIEPVLHTVKPGDIASLDCIVPTGPRPYQAMKI